MGCQASKQSSRPTGTTSDTAASTTAATTRRAVRGIEAVAARVGGIATQCSALHGAVVDRGAAPHVPATAGPTGMSVDAAAPAAVGVGVSRAHRRVAATAATAATAAKDDRI